MTKNEIKERTTLRFKNWIAWTEYTVPVAYSNYREIAAVLKDMGLDEFNDFQIRSGEVRFRNKQFMAFAIMNGLDEFRRYV